MTPLQLRIKLQRRFTPREGRKWNNRDDFPHQMAGLAGLSGEHTIRVVADPPDTAEENYNCVAHALGLNDIQAFRDKVKESPRCAARPTFLTWLIAEGKLEKIKETEGAIIVYSRDGKCEHAGLMLSGGRVLSKWGIGNLYEHGKQEVPLNYGEHIRFYRRPELDEIWEWINEFWKGHEGAL